MSGRWTADAEAKRDVLLVKYPDKTFGRVSVYRATDYVYDKGGKEYDWQGDIMDVKDLGWQMTMPHQCDEFEIGGIEAARQLAWDLQSAIDYCLSLDKPDANKTKGDQQ
jgi:hypothetical protein